MNLTHLTKDAEALNPLRHHKHLTHPEQDSFMERVSEKVASGMGTVGFIIVSSLIIFGWMTVNHLSQFVSDSYHGLLNGKGFDPAPFILLNLVFSAVAFYTGALVIIAQKAQSKRDKLTAIADAKHREELVAFQNQVLDEQTEMLKEIKFLTEKVKELVGTPQPPPVKRVAAKKAASTAGKA